MKQLMNTRIFGLPVMITLLASFWLLVFSWLWTGSLFNGATIPSLDWLAQNGLVEADVDGMPIGWQLLGIFGTMLQTAGLVTLLQWRNTSKMGEAVQTGLIAAIAFAVPVIMMPLVFRPEHNVTLFLMNLGTYVIGLPTTAMVITGLKNLGGHEATTPELSQSAVATR
ncbi:MAG: hypothetical protein AAF639_23965 [Chloroflexota bacterium]